MPQAELEQIPLHIGVDVGGTFTDLVASDGTSLHIIKIPSTPPDFHRAVVDAVQRASAFGLPSRIVHGSTVATNALLQRAGEPVAFVTTEGFRDMLLIGRQNRPHLYALNIHRPAPMTPPENWFTVKERVGANGEVVEALDPAEVERLIQHIQSRGLRHVAVCLLFSFINPLHEKMIGGECRNAGLSVSLSSEVLPEFREYERASTTVINAALRPTVEGYLNSLSKELTGETQRHGATASRRSDRDDSTPDTADRSAPSLRIMHSAGGTLSIVEAAQQAARLILSGPAGGVMGAAFMAERAGVADVITYDMGGTSTDVAVIRDGQPQWTTSTHIDGLPMGLPMFDIHTVGAGGGSIAYRDAGGALRVGPRSAGAVPGPACYGRGGTQPTVTDANLLLGRILPDHFLGGAMKIDPQLAHDAIATLANAIGKSVIDTALGIVKVAEANMEHAVRAVTSRRGHDPRQFAMLSFGGAGGLHACAVADGLEIRRVIVPPHAGVLSALGMVVAPPIVDASRTVVHLGQALDDNRLIAELGSINGITSDTLPYEQTERVEAYADVRFRGQSHELKVKLQQPTLEHIAERFTSVYRATYGQIPEGRPIEVVTLRIRRVGKRPSLELPTWIGQGTVNPSPVKLPAEPATSTQPVGDAGSTANNLARVVSADGQDIAARIVHRSDLVNRTVEGPFLLIDTDATTYVPTAWRAEGVSNGMISLVKSR